MFSCNTTQHISDGQLLVTKNEIYLSTGLENSKKKVEIDEDDIRNYLQQRPNRKILGIIPFHLSAWNYGKRLKDTSKVQVFIKRTLQKTINKGHSIPEKSKWKQLWFETIGEEPVIYEEALFNRSKKEVEQFMFNSGYFDYRVEAVAMKGEKTVEMRYYVYSDEAYRLRKLNFALEDTSLTPLLTNNKLESDLNRGDRFDASLFENERERLTNWMKNQGYYSFEKIHVIFDIDTNLDGKKYDATIRLRDLRRSKTINGKDTIVAEPHRKYYINNVYINPTYKAGIQNQSRIDTIERKGFTILSRGKPPIRPFRLTRAVNIIPGDHYTKDRTQYTYSRLRSLNNFRFIDVKFEEVESDSAALLDARINLTMAPRHAFTFETTGTNRSGNLGISGNASYQNKNIFRGAEQFNFSVYGGVEAQQTVNESTNENAEIIQDVTPFNTYEIGAELRIDIPDFIFKNTNNSLPWLKEPETSISLVADRQVRPDYVRDLFSVSYSISMHIREQDKITLSPINISLIDLEKDELFERKLQSTNNSLLINSFNDHLIPSGRISYSYTTKDFENPLKNYYQYKANLELAGNLARLFARPIGLKYVDSTDSYTVDNIRFAQYVKVDLDYAKYLNFTSTSKFVYRIYTGVGVPLSNLNTLPFARSFFAGGSNGIRAWNIRTLGPGSAADTSLFGLDQNGEMQLELNLEYRLEFTDLIEGALFVDVGNIWLLSYDPQRPGAEFRPTTFYRDLAIGPGAGIRFDFNFFIIRIDAGIKFRDPALPEGERWIFQEKKLTNEYRDAANERRINQGLSPIQNYNRVQGNINLAIGYPF